MVVASVVVDLLAGDGSAGDEVLQRLFGKRPWVPLPVIAGLALLWSIDPEQSHELGAKLNGVAVYDLEPWLSGPNHSVVIGLRVSCGGKYEGKKTETPH
jgi:hypothetical protein